MNNEEAITIENCPHDRFNSGYQRRCESGCGHTVEYIRGWNARAAEVEALSQIARDIIYLAEGFHSDFMESNYGDADQWCFKLQRTAKSLAEAVEESKRCVKELPAEWEILRGVK